MQNYSKSFIDDAEGSRTVKAGKRARVPLSNIDLNLGTAKGCLNLVTAENIDGELMVVKDMRNDPVEGATDVLIASINQQVRTAIGHDSNAAMVLNYSNDAQLKAVIEKIDDSAIGARHSHRRSTRTVAPAPSTQLATRGFAKCSLALVPSWPQRNRSTQCRKAC